MKEWKIYQQIYNSLVTEHSDDKANFPTRLDSEIVKNAVRYCLVQDPTAVYPAKSFITAIIYATLLEKHYNEDFYEVLNDPDLFCGQDEHFVTYDQAKATYDAILYGLEQVPNWIEGGWAPYTVKYFYLECTEQGVNTVNA